MANTGEIQDLTVSWEGYAGSSVEAFIKKEFTSVLSGDIGTPVENYTSSGSIMPISKVYTLDGLCVTPIVENVSGALGESTNIYFPHFYKESSFEETEKLEFYKFQYSGGRWDEIGYHYVDTEDNLPSWVIGQIISKLPTATTSANGLMSSTDKTKLDNAASISALNEKADKTTVRENERVVAEALNDLESRKANANDVYTKAQTDSAISDYTYNKTTTDNLLNNKVDKVTGKGLSTNDFKVIELSDYLTQGDELPTDANLIYTYRGKVVEKRICKLDGDNDAILFITNRDLSDYEMDDLTALAYIRSGGSDYEYTFDGLYYTNNSECPTWVKAACGITYATSENAGLMSPSMYDDLLESQKKQIVRTINANTSTSPTLSVGYDYNVTGSLNTFSFVLPDEVTDGEINILCTTGATPNILFSTSLDMYADSSYTIEANNTYKIHIRAFQGNYYITSEKMMPYTNNIFCKLTLNDESEVYIDGSGKFTQPMIENNITDKTTITKAELGKKCTGIDSSTFSMCSGLTSIKIPHTVTSIGGSAFNGCAGLTSITIPDSVTSIGDYTFNYCSGLTSITIPDSVTRIGNNAFRYSGLTSIIIPDSVTSIGDNAFENCSGLTSITIPDSVTTIGLTVFSGCTGLTSINVDSGNTIYDSRNNCNAIINTSTNTLICGCKTTIIPDSVTNIGGNAFKNCSGLTSITIPDSVTYIGENAFRNCTGLISTTIGNGVTNIRSNTFYGCSGLTSINIPDSVTSIGDWTFSDCSGLTSINIPDSVTTIGSYVFSSCSGLTSATIGNGVTSIGDNTFSECSSLTNVTIGNITSIGDWTFYQCTSLTNIVSNAMTAPTIGNITFYGVKTGGTLTVPSGSTGYDAWMNKLSGWTKIEQ